MRTVSVLKVFLIVLKWYQRVVKSLVWWLVANFNDFMQLEQSQPHPSWDLTMQSHTSVITSDTHNMIDDEQYTKYIN